MKESLRESHKLTFRKEIPAHMEALRILSYWGFSTDFVVECIIKYAHCVTKDELKKMLTDTLSDVKVVSEIKMENNNTVQEELPPDSLFDAMFDD